MKLTILVADDSEDMLDFLEADFSGQYIVLKARNGQEAIDQMASGRVQLVISDVMMPVMDGFELCRRIKADIALCHIPVILLTARNELESRINGLEIGADAYIDKPFSPVHLHVQVNNLLANRKKLTEHFANSPLAHIKSMASSESDEQFLEQINAVVIEHIKDTEFDVEKLATCMNMSRPTLYRKLKMITDLTPNAVINISRLKRASLLLATGKYAINEIAEMLGYTSAAHFSRNFHKQFGIHASDFKLKEENEWGKTA